MQVINQRSEFRELFAQLRVLCDGSGDRNVPTRVDIIYEQGWSQSSQPASR
jgi:hypothetical protein